MSTVLALGCNKLRALDFLVGQRPYRLRYLALPRR